MYCHYIIILNNKFEFYAITLYQVPTRSTPNLQNYKSGVRVSRIIIIIYQLITKHFSGNNENIMIII